MSVESVQLERGDLTIAISMEDLTVDKIAPLFGLDPMRPVWLVKKQGNLAVFGRAGKFDGPLVEPGAAYEVKGYSDNGNGGSPAAAPSASASFGGPGTSFGSYSLPTYIPPQSAHPQKKTWRKTIVLVSVKKSTKGKSKDSYDVITQVVVNLSPATCSVKDVCQLVTKQVDFDVILLDSKGYPLLSNESTSGESFWKSTRKILAANKKLYRKITGQNTDIERASIDLTKDDDSSDDSVTSLPPAKRKCVCSDLSVANKIDKISQQVSTLANSITFMQNLQRSFECVVCKGLIKTPVVAKCCGRIVGCQRCVRRWMDSHATCPHCSSIVEDTFPLKGFDNIIKCLQYTLDEKPFSPLGYLSASSDSSGFD